MHHGFSDFNEFQGVDTNTVIGFVLIYSCNISSVMDSFTYEMVGEVSKFTNKNVPVECLY